MIAAYPVKLACELPDRADRSLSLRTCAELARTAIERGVVEAISPPSVQRILQSQKLKPFNWTTKSFDKILAKVDVAIAAAA